ncbi:GFA family protein [Alteraurantiacibacter palmitatis]|uniref:GFA family protein n=1 Tax=Alteraurantiacibacter palmitatis TaxID=2054628 RepID=A0ABV7E4X9_9SPHN
MKASCQCGALSAHIDDAANPMTVLCHCRDCQRRSGSPFGVIAYFPDEAVSLHGKAQEYTRPTDAGNTFTSGFCATCGSTLYARASKYPGITGITVGTLADPGFPMPNRSVFEISRHAWVILPEAMPRHPRGRDSSYAD